MFLFKDIKTDESGALENTGSLFSRVQMLPGPEGDRIRFELEKWFASLPEKFDRSGLRSRFLSQDNAAHMEAFIELYLREMAARQGLRQDISTAIIQFAGATGVELRKSLYESLESVAGVAETNDEQFVICINAEGVEFPEDVIIDTLYGSLHSYMEVNGRRRVGKAGTRGFWGGLRGTRNLHVSAVLFAYELSPRTVARNTPVLWHNPWAANPIDPGSWQGPQKIIKLDNDLVLMHLPGKEAWRILGLSPAWPSR